MVIQKKSIRSSEIIRLSVVELLFLIVFSLILVLSLSGKHILDLEGNISTLREAQEELARLRAEHTKLVAIAKELQNQFDQKQKELVELRVKLIESQTRIKELEEQVKPPPQTGRGKPPCSLAGRPNTEILFTIVIQDGALRVILKPTGDLTEAASDVPGVRDFLAARSLTTAQFAEAGLHIERWGDKQLPPCRFSVRILDETESKDGYKKQMQLVQRFFYLSQTRD